MAAVSRDNATLIAWLTGRPTWPPFPCVAVRGGADRASRDAFERRALDRMRARDVDQLHSMGKDRSRRKDRSGMDDVIRLGFGRGQPDRVCGALRLPTAGT